jgi:hypothetical protein
VGDFFIELPFPGGGTDPAAATWLYVRALKSDRTGYLPRSILGAVVPPQAAVGTASAAVLSPDVSESLGRISPHGARELRLIDDEIRLLQRRYVSVLLECGLVSRGCAVSASDETSLRPKLELLRARRRLVMEAAETRRLERETIELERELLTRQSQMRRRYALAVGFPKGWGALTNLDPARHRIKRNAHSSRHPA